MIVIYCLGYDARLIFNVDVAGSICDFADVLVFLFSNAAKCWFFGAISYYALVLVNLTALLNVVLLSFEMVI